MRNPLQEQLLKAGLVKKHNVDAAVRAQKRQRDGKAPAPPTAEQIDARRLQAEKAERDRALAAERNALAREKEKLAQIRQLIAQHRVDGDGEIPYHFADGAKLASVLVSEPVRKQLASGALVIVAGDDAYALLPRAAGELVRERGGTIVLDHAASPAASASDDDYYSRFVVPDDLIW